MWDCVLSMCGCSGWCSTGEFECVVDGGCVMASQLCDGVRHCPAGSDEDWRADCASPSAARMSFDLFACTISFFLFLIITLQYL